MANDKDQARITQSQQAAAANVRKDVAASAITPKDMMDAYADIPSDMRPLQLSRRFWNKGTLRKPGVIRGFIVDVETMRSKRYGDFTALIFRVTEPTEAVDMDGVVEPVPVGQDVIVVATVDLQKLALAKGSPLLTEVWLKLTGERPVPQGVMHTFTAAQGRQVKRSDFAPDTLSFGAGTNASTYALGIGSSAVQSPAAALPAAQVEAQAPAKA